MQVKFCPIASGSSGNSIYVGTDNTHILVDAGLSGAAIQKGLGVIGVSGDMLDAIFVTHEHTDHIQGVGVLSRRFNVPVYATAKTWDMIDRFKTLGKISPENKRFVYSGERCIVNDICINPFEIPHDAADPVGYSLSVFGKKICIATDIGYVTDTIKENISDSDALLLESNHDEEMLRNGRYPQALKARILGKRGHLSNVSCGRLLAEIMSNRLRHVFLGHLSEENNRPLIALDTVTTILNANKIFEGENFKVTIAARNGISEALVL